jgi:crossover junction endodeoxyribonuclease RuvC
MRILGIDPGLQKTGWGIICYQGARLGYVASGTIKTHSGNEMYQRLYDLDAGMREVIASWAPDMAAIEETFMNNNAASALKLGQARGVVMAAPARAGLAVAEYAPNLIKKAIVGTGHAGKEQMMMMVGTLLPMAGKRGEDEADALAVAICHAHQTQTNTQFQQVNHQR